MRYLPITTGLVLSLLLGSGSNAHRRSDVNRQSSDPVIHEALRAQHQPYLHLTLDQQGFNPLAQQSSQVSTAGFRVKKGPLQTTFRKVLTKTYAECENPRRRQLVNMTSSGEAQEKIIKFISYSTPPAKGLRVKLINLTLGKEIIKKYKNSEGSSRFSLQELGSNYGKYKIQYRIFNDKTRKILEEEIFTFSIETFSEIKTNKSCPLERSPASGSDGNPEPGSAGIHSIAEQLTNDYSSP